MNAVMDVMVDGDFYANLDLPDLGRPEVLAETSGSGPEDGRGLRLRYHYTGHLDPIARSLLGGGDLFWLQDVRVDPAAASGRLDFAAESQPDRLHGWADLVFRASGSSTVRGLEGEVVVAVPLVGATAERRVIDGLLARLEIEAGAIDAQLRTG